MPLHPIQLRMQRQRERAGTRRSQVIRLLARRTRKSPDAIMEGIPAETLKRLRVPVTVVENEDGSLTFKDIRAAPGTMKVSSPGVGSSLLQPGSNESLRAEPE
jgi:hypothetical protein